MTDNELLLAISKIVSAQVEPLKKDINGIKATLENEIFPRLQNIESCYTTTYKRYQSGANQIDAMQVDIDIMKEVMLYSITKRFQTQPALENIKVTKYKKFGA